MTNEQKLIALAKLDGWHHLILNDEWGPDRGLREHEQASVWCKFTDLSVLLNGDEIRRLIGKQTGNVIRSIERGLNRETEKVLYPFLANAEQLAELLLRATGNWKD